MSKLTKRDSAVLARVVPQLPPEALHELIRSHGLDACSEIVTLATPAQLNAVLDLDLWSHPQPGRDEQFDVDRFGEWLETLANAGDAAAAQTVAAIDKDLVIAGLTRYVRVFDAGIFEPTAPSDDETIERGAAMREGDAIYGSRADWLECEVGGYIVRARRADAWDAIVSLLVTIEAEHNAHFHAVMQGCRRLSNSRPESDGLDDLLLAPEQHLHEFTIERERRRSQQGYATPADARAFLEMARRTEHATTADRPARPPEVNPIFAAYRRELDGASSRPNDRPRRPSQHQLETASTLVFDAAESIESMMEVLSEAGVIPARPRGLLDAGGADAQPNRLTTLRRLMMDVRDRDESVYLARSQEMAFIANTLLAGCSIQSRAFTPGEASDAAAAICNLGLEHLPVSDAFLLDHDLVAVFETGWSVLHRDVAIFAAGELIATLADLESIDRELRLELAALRHTLVKQRDSGTPWRARHAAEILAMLDTTVWISVLGLLDECPMMPAALTAILEGRTTSVCATAFEFISSADQIGEVRRFTRKLPDLLSR